MKVAFIGAGAVFLYHSQQWCRGINESFPNSTFYVVEPDDVAARDTNMQRLPDAEWAAQTCDAAIILTPSYLRWQVAFPFITRNKPVIIEKPLTISKSELFQFEEAEKRGGWICPVVNARCIPKIEHMYHACEGLERVESFKVRHRPPAYYRGWHGKFATDGGVLAQQGFHCLDLVCWFGGLPMTVRATGARRLHKGIECEDTAEVEILFKSGATGLVNCTTAASKNGDAGLIVEAKSGHAETRGAMFAGGTPGHTVLAMRAFDALKKGNGPPITVQSAGRSVRALHAAYCSMDDGGRPVAYGAGHPLLGNPGAERIGG